MIHSTHFGRAFWLDDYNEFCSAPWRKDGTVEDLNWDYVSEWNDMEGVDLDKLFNIHRELVTDRVSKEVFNRYNAENITRDQIKSIKGNML